MVCKLQSEWIFGLIHQLLCTDIVRKSAETGIKHAVFPADVRSGGDCHDDDRQYGGGNPGVRRVLFLPARSDAAPGRVLRNLFCDNGQERMDLRRLALYVGDEIPVPIQCLYNSP